MTQEKNKYHLEPIDFYPIFGFLEYLNRLDDYDHLNKKNKEPFYAGLPEFLILTSWNLSIFALTYGLYYGLEKLLR